MPIDLDLLARRLDGQYRDVRPALAVRVANRGRLLTMLPEAAETSPPSPSSLKGSGRAAPPGKAFDLYVAREDAKAAVQSQRIAPPVQSSPDLEIEEGVRERSWTLPGAKGERIVIRLRLGEEMSASDARRLLATLQQSLSP